MCPVHSLFHPPFFVIKERFLVGEVCPEEVDEVNMRKGVYKSHTSVSSPTIQWDFMLNNSL